MRALVAKDIIWYNVTEEFFFIDCTAELRFDFTFGDDQVYTLDQNDLIVKSTNSKYCITLISALDPAPYSNVPDWHLGTVFHRRYCHAYNFEKKTMSLTDYNGKVGGV